MDRRVAFFTGGKMASKNAAVKIHTRKISESLLAGKLHPDRN